MKLAVVSDLHYGFNNKTHEIHVQFFKKLREACDVSKVDALIHCGDWIANNQHQMPRAFKMLRGAMGELPILGVFGNHDNWSADFWLKRKSYCSALERMSLHEMAIQHHTWADEYKIHLLQRNPYFHGTEVAIYGFNGWYGLSSPNTNDAANMPLMYESSPALVYLSHEAGKELGFVLDEVEKIPFPIKKVCVTHFPSYSHDPNHEIYCANISHMDFITDKFDLLLHGHSHQIEDWCAKSKSSTNICRVVNPGTIFDKYSGGYNKPNFVIINI